MLAPLPIPADTIARLHVLNAPPVPGFRYAVILARPPIEAVPEALVEPGGLSTVLTHHADRDWPDAKGAALAVASLERGGIAVLAFCTLGDAGRCHSRLTRRHGGPA